jgi:hypothetical protein
MGNIIINKICIRIVLSLFMIGTACANSHNRDTIPEEKRVLQGKVTIGPLCPVEPCNLSPEQIAKVYERRKVIVYEQNTKKKIAKIDLNQSGEYSVSLKPGKYIVDVTDGNGNELPLERVKVIIGNVQKPKEIEIKASESVEVNFHIDTGIR